MLKNGFLGRRDEPQTPAGGRASPDSPRYAPQPDAAPLSAVAVSHPAASSAPASARSTEVKSTTGTIGSDLLRETPAATTTAAPVSNAGTASGSTNNGAPRLTVGPNIKLKGAEINDCDTLVVEGHVEASMDSKTLEILKTGSYAGTVTIDIAEIHGKFEGNLTARKKLIVHASGCVSGTVRYGSLLVSEGGVVSGDIAAIDGKGDSQGALFAGYPSARASTGTSTSKLAGVEHVAA